MLTYLLLNSLTQFQKQLEQQAASLSASLVLPEPQSGRIFLRLTRLPIDGPETIIDVKSFGKRYFITVTRFIEPLRISYQSFLNKNLSGEFCVPVEISTSECSLNEPLVKECKSSYIYDLKSNFISEDNTDFYYLFCTDSFNCVTSFTTYPHNQTDELWQRIINRSYGAELVPPRRYSRKLVSSFYA
jgi:hypothetical protein